MIIPFFLMNRGCPQRCIFCNERLTVGSRSGRITEEAFSANVRAHLEKSSRRRRPGQRPPQIAFYGGTFTGMERPEQRRLLDLSKPFLQNGTVDGIRISTRPGGIDPEYLDDLKASGVKTVEVGAQSLDDRVLHSTRRGHTEVDVFRTIRLLKEKKLETGIHLMAGLPGDNPERFAATVRKTVDLRPDMVRIHPTLVLKDTPLAEKFKRGEYSPLNLSEAIDLCRDALKTFAGAGIPVIRLGLQTTREMEEPGAVVGGPFHPAFRSLVEASLFLEMAVALLSTVGGNDGNPEFSFLRKGSAVPRFTVSPADISSLRGQKNENMASLKGRFHLRQIDIQSDVHLPRQTLVLTANGKQLRTDFTGRIDICPTDSMNPWRRQPAVFVRGKWIDPDSSDSDFEGHPR